jgi:endonuclease/exonuclease/phosphatase family metal-dependent hydrolase
MIALGYQVHPKVFAFQMPSPVETNSDSTLRIMSYNAHSFRPINTNKYDKKSKHSMLELLLSEKADIICFQEFYTRKKGEYAIKDSLQKFS